MAAAPFTPPRYTETHHYIFDRKTGEILATETRWTDEGAEGLNTDLVRRVAEDSGRVEGDVDVLQAPKRTYQGHLRVDVATRNLISAPAFPQPVQPNPAIAGDVTVGTSRRLSIPAEEARR
jgi:hypothetical protein